MSQRLLISTLPTVSCGLPFVEIALVQGQSVRTRNVFMSFFGEFRFIFGGKMNTFSELLKLTREEAIDDMLANAKYLQADAIIGFRLQNSSIEEGASEVLAYGTAIKWMDSPLIKSKD